ncbi:Lrp/AsnC family transcriptional regulator [Candidatus Woesearchaeota archaeon]|nr:Lrp/AsnC family transcriptional regulator [Candidatus Woesearchaeota archaeon]
MDKINSKILQVLDWNARTPISKIAKFVKSNKDVVAYRIKKLEEEGIITNYFPILDMYKLGYHTSRLYLDLEEINAEDEKDLIEFLDREIGCGLILSMDYPYKYCIFLWKKSIYGVEQSLVEIKKYLGKKLIRYNHSIICTFRQYPKDYLFGKKMHEAYRSLEPNKEIEYDDKDYRILKELAKNARFSTVNIAKTLSIPQTTVSSKIRNLEKKKIILGYRAQINISKLKYLNYFLEIYLDENINLKEIEAWTNTNKNVVWLQKTIGTCDIEVEVEVQNRKELDGFMNKLKTKFLNIRKIVFWPQHYKKLTFLP